MFIEVSAKTGVNIKQLFKELAQSLPGIGNEEGEKPSSGVKLEQDTKKPDGEDVQESSGKKTCCK